jgi:hypothetical protein
MVNVSYIFYSIEILPCTQKQGVYIWHKIIFIKLKHLKKEKKSLFKFSCLYMEVFNSFLKITLSSVHYNYRSIIIVNEWFIQWPKYLPATALLI